MPTNFAVDPSRARSARLAGAVTAGAGLVMIVGSFLTWMALTSRGSSGDTVNIAGVGASASNVAHAQQILGIPSPGWLVVLLGLLALVGAAFYFRPALIRTASSVPLGVLLGGGAGLVALLTCAYYGMSYLNGPVSDYADEDSDYKVSLGIGFWLVTAASIACIAVAVIPAKHWIASRGQSNPLPPQAPSVAPPTGQQPPAPAPQQQSVPTPPQPYRPSWQASATPTPTPPPSVPASQQATPPAQAATPPSSPTPPSSDSSKKPYKPSY